MPIDLTRNYFALFGLPESFEVDLSSLSARYQDLQRSVHPDKFANATDRERRISMQQASLVNEAYQALRDPLKRARYMLGEKGIDINDESNTIMDTAFLMQQMELREALDDISASDDPLSGLETFTTDIESMIADLVARLKSHFDNDTDEDLQQAHGLSLQLQFLYRLREEAEDREEALL